MINGSVVRLLAEKNDFFFKSNGSDVRWNVEKEEGLATQASQTRVTRFGGIFALWAIFFFGQFFSLGIFFLWAIF
jgi:hypothetical protein